MATPALVMWHDGKPGAGFPIEKDEIIIGRDESCDLVLPDGAVSRIHARVHRDEVGCRLTDAESRNGTIVNGVRRGDLILHDGDELRIGPFVLRFQTGHSDRVANAHSVELKASADAELDLTRELRMNLPEAREERHLSTLYHICFWALEVDDFEHSRKRMLQVLTEGLDAAVGQWYDPDTTLALEIRREKVGKPVKFARYLVGQFHELREVRSYGPNELARFQERAGRFHVMAVPVRERTGSGPCPVLVFLRPKEWKEYTAEDRTLTNAVARLMTRQQARAAAVRAIQAENRRLKESSSEGAVFIGKSRTLKGLQTRLRKIAASTATVLITGESGSGKEIAARFLHSVSPRASGPFVRINCAAIPESLIESELFGHVKGAFTDARSDRLGKFSQATGGTLLLDEIGELPISVQAKLLRAIENDEIEPLGSERPLRIDVRIIASTNRDLEAMTRKGAFRQDLFYRLDVIRVITPPLREHPEDIPELATHFLGHFCAENGLAELQFSMDALEVLHQHRWPGNVRELRNAVQRCAVESENLLIEASEVRAQIER